MQSSSTKLDFVGCRESAILKNLGGVMDAELIEILKFAAIVIFPSALCLCVALAIPGTKVGGADASNISD